MRGPLSHFLLAHSIRTLVHLLKGNWRVLVGLLGRAPKPPKIDCPPFIQKPESVYFYTFHKCASTLFSSYALKQIEGLKHVNYANQIYSGKWTGETDFVFNPRGNIYGPIRVNSNPGPPLLKAFCQATCTPEFVRDKVAIFLIRDPRDILVSSYFSFGFSHGLSPVDGIRGHQEELRGQIQAVSLDEYVLAAAHETSENFRLLGELHSACERSVLLKYEDLIHNFDHFIAEFSKQVSLAPAVVQEIYQRSRPVKKEDNSSHRRSGQVGGFRGKLKEETVQALSRELAPILERFQYEV